MAEIHSIASFEIPFQTWLSVVHLLLLLTTLAGVYMTDIEGKRRMKTNPSFRNLSSLQWECYSAGSTSLHALESIGIDIWALFGTSRCPRPFQSSLRSMPGWRHFRSPLLVFSPLPADGSHPSSQSQQINSRGVTPGGAKRASLRKAHRHGQPLQSKGIRISSAYSRGRQPLLLPGAISTFGGLYFKAPCSIIT